MASGGNKFGGREKDEMYEESNHHRFDSESWKITEFLIEEFCQENFLLVKAVKEVHFLCL